MPDFDNLQQYRENNRIRETYSAFANAEGKQIIAITVPKADAKHRPVYIGSEGDSRLAKEEIDTMLAQRRSCHAL